jgi:hypothetical protein
MKYGVMEGQQEYINSRVRGYGFTNHGKWWHWMYMLDQINPTDRERLEKEFPENEYFIWSLNTYGEELIVTPVPKGKLLDWTTLARAVAAKNGGE